MNANNKFDLGKYTTFRWTMTVGTAAGYSTEERERMPEKELAALFQRIAAEVMEEGGAYISAVLMPSRVIYHTDWGCPAGGEPTYTFSGSCNPAFAEPEAYRKALDEVARRLKEALLQATVLLELSPAELVYYRDEKK